MLILWFQPKLISLVEANGEKLDVLIQLKTANREDKVVLMNKQ